MSPEPDAFASRAGLKLQAALDAFELPVEGLVCADFGCNVGGFTDCLLQRGAARVYAVDTGYGDLAWTLRNHPAVVVMERTNALHTDPPEPVDLVTIDVAWTPQKLILPAGQRWLKPDGHIVSLLKPVYELDKIQPRRGRKKKVSLTPEATEEVLKTVCSQIRDVGFAIRSWIPSPIEGKGGNREFLLLISPPGE